MEAKYVTWHNTLQDLINTLWSRTHQTRRLAQLDLDWAQNWGRQSAKRHKQILNALRKPFTTGVKPPKCSYRVIFFTLPRRAARYIDLDNIEIIP